MRECRRRTLWPVPTALLLGLPVLYVASFGPVCWMADRAWLPRDVVRPAVYPLALVAVCCPPAVATFLIDYSGEQAGLANPSVARETMVRAVGRAGPW